MKAAGTRIDNPDRCLARAAAGAPQARTKGLNGDLGLQPLSVEHGSPATAFAEGYDGKRRSGKVVDSIAGLTHTAKPSLAEGSGSEPSGYDAARLR